MGTNNPKKQTYYEILGVRSNASAEEIKKTYIKLARRYHPDRQAGDKNAETKFAEITEAYRTLSNTSSRYAYDLELGIEPGSEVVPAYERIEQAPVTGSVTADYVETLMGAIPVPTLQKVDEDTYRFKGLDNKKIREAYEKGIYSIGILEKADMYNCHELGMKYLKENKFDKALAYCIEAVKMNPRNMNFRFSLGCCFEAKGFIKEAVEEYEQTLKLASEKHYTCLPVREALISLLLKLKMFNEIKEQCMELWEMGLSSAIAEKALHMVHLEERK